MDVFRHSDWGVGKNSHDGKCRADGGKFYARSCDLLCEREGPLVMVVMMESRTYILLQIIASHVRSHAEEVPEHTQHDVIAKDDDLLPEEI